MPNYTILLIDYEPRSIERFREPLLAAGYSVEIANDGISGIEAFHRLSPDMVLVEAMIPKKHGFEVCQELKRTPHGQKTPVIITTGVYKGRKYRTQALHIYGCDEYIEKPIAPQQLLGIVGKFLDAAPTSAAGGAQPPPPSASKLDREPSREPQRVVDVNSSSISAPLSINKDDAEDEIMARLDAIIPTGSSAANTLIQDAPVAIVAPDEQDPFAQMRAELDAELDALPDLAFGPGFAPEPTLEPLPSDQVVSATVLEALPLPEVPVPAKDSKRSRQKKQKTKSDARQVPDTPPAVVAQAPPAPAFKQAIPRGTIVESAVKPEPARRRIPLWSFAIAGVVAIVAVWFLVFSNDNPKAAGSGSPPIPAKPSAPVSSTISTPAPTTAEPLAAAPVATTPVVASPAATTSVVAAPAATPSIAASQPSSRPAVPEPRKGAASHLKSQPIPVRAPATASTSSAPPSDPRAETPPPGLKTVAEPVVKPETTPPQAPAAAAPVPTMTALPAPLIPIDQADTMPVPLSHKFPVFSDRVKQMGLSGTVVMNILVNDHGKVDQVVLVTGIDGADVNDVALSAARAWTYRPATKSGVPVKVWKSERITVAP